MKKITYILLPILIVFMAYQPLNNWYSEHKRVQEEKYINSLIGENFNYEEMKASTRKDQRPDLRGLKEYLMTYDLSTKRIPKEKLLDGIQEIVMNTQEDLLKSTGKKEVQTILEEEPEH